MSAAPDLIKHLDRTLADLKQRRLDREGEWQQIADYFAPSKDFTVQVKPGQLRRRRLTSSVPAVARARSAALFAGYLVDPVQPFVLPNVEQDLVAAGLPAEVDDEARDYLANVGWQIFGRMMSTKSGFLAGVAGAIDEAVTFGAGVLWNGRKRGAGPRYRNRPLRSCWLAEDDEEGLIDTLYYEFCWPLWRVIRRWPAAAKLEGWDTTGMSEAQAEARLREEVTLVHVVEPRNGGRVGAVREAKPYAEYYASLEKKALLEEGGYDTFPFSVPRLNPIPGSAYGRGLCWSALPDAMALSWLQQMTEQGVANRVDPPLMAPARMFGKALDRRAGALNFYDSAGLGFMSAREAIQRLDVSGDVNVGVEYMRFLTQNVEQALFTDWMRLRETGQMTAEEVIERRELRLRAMSALIPGVDRQLMASSADRTLAILVAEGQLGEAPRSIAGRSVEWDYAGPLARAQQRHVSEGMTRLFEQALVASKIDPAAGYVIDVPEAIRASAEAYGAPVGALRSREAVAQRIAADMERQAAAEQIQAAQGMATTLRDGGQGLLNVKQAVNDDAAQAA